MTNLISDDKILFNGDEATYSTSVKCNYTWFPKGQSNPIINSNSSGKTKVVFGLATDANWVAIFSNLTMDSIKFWRFLFILKKFVELWMGERFEDVRYTLNNAPVHVSMKVKKAAEVLDMRLLLLPPYSPSLALVEWVFGMSKKILAHQNQTKSINYSKRSGKMMIIDWFKRINKTLGVRIWMQSINKIEGVISSIRIPLYIDDYEQNPLEEAGE